MTAVEFIPDSSEIFSTSGRVSPCPFLSERADDSAQINHLSRSFDSVLDTARPIPLPGLRNPQVFSTSGQPVSQRCIIAGLDSNFPGTRRFPMLRCILTALTTSLLSSVAVLATDSSVPSFRHDVLPVLSKSGCSLGTCHGNQRGKGGLRLSLYGQDPPRDYDTLTRQTGARRLNFLAPADSLLLQKPRMVVAHQGGRRIEKRSWEYQILHDWIAAGAPNDTHDAPELVHLNVSPSRITVYAPENSVTLRVRATLSDGAVRNVTSLANCEPSSLHVAVTADGVVRLNQPGASVVNVRYQHLQTTVSIEYVAARPSFSWSGPDPVNFIDKAIFSRLKRICRNPADICDDTTFVRRAYLDLPGLPQTQSQARQFVTSSSGDKHAALIDRLLESPAFSDFQALHWADVLRVEDKTLAPKASGSFTAGFGRASPNTNH